MKDLPIELINAINNDNLLIFAGAGLSYNLLNINDKQLKGWSNLVENILDDLKNKGYEVDILIPLVLRYDPIRVLDLIEIDKNIPKNEIIGFTKDFLDLRDDNNFVLHKKLFDLSKKLLLQIMILLLKLQFPN